jgi:hypothetical protein
VRRLLATCAIGAALALPVAAVDFFPLDQLRPGMKGVGRTVFAGEKIEEFGVEILGVLENIGPKQSIILGRLSGGPLAKTGVMAGMSGSPVYIDGKLVGAVALAFPFATEPIAGIRPISEMVEPFEQRAEPPPAGLRAALAALQRPGGGRVERWIPAADLRLLPVALDPVAGQSKLIPIATPMNFAGFTSRTLNVFGPALRELGLEPMQGAGGGSTSRSSRMGDPSTMQPGSMISVALVRGDLSVNADGVVTHIDGNRIYAFGHRFLSAGPTDLPFMRSSVMALLPNLANSFKISAAGELMGSIRQDRSTGIFGELGTAPRLIPVDVNLYSSRNGNQAYHLEIVNDRFFSPFLLQMAIYSAIDATERTLGASTFQVRGSIQFGGSQPPVVLDNVYAADNNNAILVAFAAAQPMAYVMQSSFPDLRVERVRLEVESIDQKKQLKLDRVWAEPREAKAGEQIALAAVLRGENGQETVRRVNFRIPPGTPEGPLSVTIADGAGMNLLDLRGLTPSREAATSLQLVRAINELRRNNKLYVRVWRTDRGFQVENDPLPSPPASLRALLAGGAAATGGLGTTYSAVLDEMELAGFDTAVAGSETIRLTVKP